MLVLLVREMQAVLTLLFGRGNGGNLTINARESIKITGRSETSRSGIFAPTIEGSGDGGDISIISDKLVIEDEALISVSNFPSI